MTPRNKLPPFEDALLVLSEAQKEALHSYYVADEDAKRIVRDYINRWDKALGRGDTFDLERRQSHALHVWGPHLFSEGLGI